MLQSKGILCTEQQVRLYKLWDIMSTSKVVFVRAGKHLCIPWRMIDLLAMGSAIVSDAQPYPIWPEPLKNSFKIRSFVRPMALPDASVWKRIFMLMP